MPLFLKICRSNEETCILRLKDHYYEDQKRVCQTMGWKDFYQESLSAYDGDLGCVEAKVRQIIQEQDEKKKNRKC